MFARPSMPTRSSASTATASTERSIVDDRWARPDPNVEPTSTFSNTVSPSNGRGICDVRPMPMWQRTCAERRVTSTPSRVDRARVGPQVTGDQVEQRCLAGAVGPDDPDRVTLGDLERETVDDGQAAEPLGQSVDREQRRHGSRWSGLERHHRAAHGDLGSPACC